MKVWTVSGYNTEEKRSWICDIFNTYEKALQESNKLEKDSIENFEEDNIFIIKEFEMK